MTSKLIKDYVKVYNNFLDEDTCLATIESLENNDWEKHHFYAERSSEHITYDTDLSVSMPRDSQQTMVNNKIWFAIERYILKDFEEFTPHFTGWEGYSEVRFNRYDEATEMQIHCDHIKSLFTGDKRGIPILSVVGVLNDDYEGGEFIMWQDTKIELPAGSIMIFPSNFMYPHKVTPVTKGVRYSYVSWVW